MNVPKTAAGIVVHSVLNPSAANQVVLLERTLSGAVDIKDTPFDGTDPIASAGGIPISGATVDIVDPSGRSFRGVEDLTVLKNGKGGGVYRFPISGAALVLGGRYQLKIHTTQGEDASGFTRIPRADVRSSGALTRTMNRDHDTLFVAWAAAGGRAYAVRIESPFGPFFLFTDSTRFGFTGELRNIFSGDLQRVFIPGFRQDMLVATVDSNFYDYYRTTNDPFTGSGIINRITGGLGIFGAMVPLTSGTLNVIADQTEPIEGRFRLSSFTGTTSAFLSQVILYVESPSAGQGLPASISGRYTTSAPIVRSDGILGQQFGTFVSLALLVNQLSVDTLDVFAGELRGDSLIGTYRTNGGTAVFLRSP
ncbi:MAG: DUF4249 family protein [Gemmatimonadaceae bacterium]